MSRLTELHDSTPELQEVGVDAASNARIQRLADFIGMDGGSVAAIVRRIEWLKFESIVREKSISEILAASD